MMMLKTQKLKLKELERDRLRRSQYLKKLFSDSDLTAQFFIKDRFKSPLPTDLTARPDPKPPAPGIVRLKSEDSLMLLVRSPKPKRSGELSKCSRVPSSTCTGPREHSVSSGHPENGVKVEVSQNSCRLFHSPRPSHRCWTEQVWDFNSRRMSSARTVFRISASKPASAYKTSAVQSTLPFFISKLKS